MAAGHRPCAECRRERYIVFKDAWKRANAPEASEAPLASEMDALLHPSRINHRGEKVTYEAALDSLPDGCFVRIEGFSYLLWKTALLLWSPEGYVKKDQRPSSCIVTVLTPEPVVRCILHGYAPDIHESSLKL